MPAKVTEARRDAASVVEFWRKAGPRLWFSKSPAFDRDFRDRFLPLHMAAAGRQLDGWAATVDGALALLILLDQFPRNAFRGTGHMYATDPLARYFARRTVTAGHDRQVDRAMRLFCYLPFAHSEDIDDQHRSVALHEALGRPWLDHALGHRDIIERFGRFPHRNDILGRDTTPDERRFLSEGGFTG